MIKQEIIEKTKEFVRSKLKNDATGHDFYHSLRVCNSALAISHKEGGDKFIITLAALLHDISDHKFNNGNELVGAHIASNWLRDCKVNNEIITKVVNIIATISYKAGTNHFKQETIEGKIVQDADRLDAIGAIGIARTFAYGGSKNRDIYNPEIKMHSYDNYEQYKNTGNHTINHFYEKLLLLKDLMNTDTAKRIALKRHQYLENFLNQFYEEWNGHDLD